MDSLDEYPAESRVTGAFNGHAGKTLLTVTMLYPSRKVRDAVLQSGMEHGAAESDDKLAELLASRLPVSG